MKTIKTMTRNCLLAISLLATFVGSANAQSWNLAGNAATDPATMFIGTTDSKALRFRTNNGVRMHISSFGKIGIGTTSPIFKMDLVGGSYNTDSLYRIKGVAVLSRDNTNRIQLGDATARVGIGTAAPANTLQVVGDASFSQDINVNGITIGKGGGGYLTNTATGGGALFSNTTGFDNTSNGYIALNSNTTGHNNSAYGSAALFANTTGYHNTANGNRALYSNSDGIGNTANGYQALYSNTTGSENTANGSFALYSNTTGNSNTANGPSALFSNTTGFANTTNGYFSIYSNTTGYGNTANGFQALYSNTDGYNNTANGTQALYSNTSGYFNTANGSSALYSNTTGNRNTANGLQALYSNNVGEENTANGSSALYSNTTGNRNTANGLQALYSNTTGSDNAANGYQALYLNTTGYYNTANGFQALRANVSGLDVTAVGANAGDSWSNIINSVFVGSLSDATTNSLGNTTAIGYNALVDASNKVRIGSTAVTSIGGQVAWTTFSDGRYKRDVEEDVPGLEFITKLRPVTYTSDITGLNNHYPKPELREGQRQAPEQDVTSQEAIRYSGFIAQEVETAAKEIGYDFSGVDKPQREGNLYGLRYSDFVVPMVKAIQELSKENQELKKRLEALESNDNNTGAIKIGLGADHNEILLGQNIPNPADNSTIIPFSIPSNCKSASILITDHATGRAIKAVPLSCKDTHLMLDAGSLASGTYSYSLFVDGVNIDTKQMVIVK